MAYWRDYFGTDDLGSRFEEGFAAYAAWALETTFKKAFTWQLRAYSEPGLLTRYIGDHYVRRADAVRHHLLEIFSTGVFCPPRTSVCQRFSVLDFGGGPGSGLDGAAAAWS